MTSKVLGSWPPEHGAVQAVAPHVEHLLAPNPSSWTYEGTNSYVIAHGGASVLIDPAVTDATHLDALRRRGQHDGRQVSAILLTHDHPDHSDGARELAELVDAPIVCFSPRFADEQPAHEQLIDLDGLPIHVLHTPGHSDDSLCLWIPENDVLITGDTLLGKCSAGVMGSLGELFTSIAMLRDLVGSRTVTALPGHGPDFDDVAGSVARVESVRARRIDQVRAHIADGNTTLEALTSRIYPELTGSRAKFGASTLVSTVEHLAGLSPETGIKDPRHRELILADIERYWQERHRRMAAASQS